MKNKKIIMRLPLLLMGLFLIFAISCYKEDDNLGEENVPILTTTEVTDIASTAATSGGNITDDGGTAVVVRGVCWSTNENPTIDDNKTEDSTDVNSFKSIITDLEPNTTYYVRAYATNSAGTGYGSILSFKTEAAINGSSFTDPRDGKVYQTVFIGNQEWMAQNLAYAPSSGNYWSYNNNNVNAETYGYLYNWQTAQNVCPSGWHLPSDAEWTVLITYLGGQNVAGGKMKKTGTSHWNSPNTGATNTSGFSALPGGYRDLSGNFDYIGTIGNFWSATSYDNTNGWYRYIRHNSGIVLRDFCGSKGFGFSVRCVRD